MTPEPDPAVIVTEEVRGRQVRPQHLQPLPLEHLAAHQGLMQPFVRLLPEPDGVQEGHEKVGAGDLVPHPVEKVRSVEIAAGGRFSLQGYSSLVLDPLRTPDELLLLLDRPLGVGPCYEPLAVGRPPPVLLLIQGVVTPPEPSTPGWDPAC